MIYCLRILLRISCAIHSPPTRSSNREAVVFNSVGGLDGALHVLHIMTDLLTTVTTIAALLLPRLLNFDAKRPQRFSEVVKGIRATATTTNCGRSLIVF